MFDWNAQTNDPTDKATGLKLQAFLTSLMSFYTGSRNDFLRDYFRGAQVLDIGAGEHNPDYYREDRWEHGIISKAAAYSVGVEINQELCDHYNKKGFRFVCVDATSDADLNERFTRVFMGDVIEHVGDPVALLQFAKRHLAGNGQGRMLVSTPNPFALSFLFARKRKENRPFFMANFEHMFWVTPTNANELARRAGLKLTGIYFPKPAWSSIRSPKELAKAIKARLLPALGLTELLHKEYMYEFTAEG